MHKLSVLLGLAAAAAIGNAQADAIHVHVEGTVQFNYNKGAISGVGSGALATMDFNLDSANFIDSAKYPTRGYAIDLSSLTLNLGGVPLMLDTAQATTYFVLRNNDPRVDGFFMSHGTDDQSSMSMRIPGMQQTLEFNFLRTFGNNGGGQDQTLKSTHLMDALGTYGMSQVSDFEWTIGFQGTAGTSMTPTTLTISAVPEPASYALMGLGLGAVALLARRRKTA